MAATARILCKCSHEYQDKLYGKQVRLANATAKGDQQNVEVRCTVCKQTQRVPIAKVNK